MTELVNASIQNNTGVLELNRPRALNSLNQEMIDGIHQALDQWRDNDEVEQVLIYAPERGFCAGGDVRTARELLLEGKDDEVRRFFVDEYAMNNAIATYPKPYIALIDGVAMGGGLGVSAHGSHRIITDKAFAAMPEMAIGYIPDVGVTYMTQRMVGKRGQASPAVAAFIGLAGYHLKPEDMIWTGLATHFVPSEKADELREAIIAKGVEEALAAYATDLDCEGSTIKRYIEEIEECFGQSSWDKIAAAIDKHQGSEFYDFIQELIAPACPTSLVAAAEVYNANEHVQSVREALDNELAVGTMAYQHPNFVEGVRAVLVDKDRNATFEPASAAEVDPQPYRDALEH